MESQRAQPASSNTETYGFSADIAQLMSLIINTFYSNKDIFLRELISNASDALDKIRYQSLTDPDALKEDSKLEIKVKADKENKKLIIEDTGIGMTKQDLINNLGTIAKSGTKAFMEAIQAGADISMIGQFGVGFYAAYLTSELVTVISKHNDDEAFKWESSAGGSFDITPIEAPADLKRGTRIILSIKPGCEEYLEEDKLKELIKKYSNFISFKISLWVTKEEEQEVTDDEIEENEETEEDKPVIEEVKEGEEEVEKKKTKTIKVQKQEWEHLNQEKPLWLKKPEDVTHEEYAEFYKSFTGDYREHLAVKHFNIEGQLEFSAIIFLPTRIIPGLFGDAKKSNVKLYVRKVFITDNCNGLVPEWLSFVSVLVNSEDLPLNISRENLQENKVLKVISKTLIKKSLELLSEVAEDDDKYEEFYKNFAKLLKLGIYNDSNNNNNYKTKLCKLLRFKTSKSGNTMTSLDNYVKDMKENQKSIYYMTGSSAEEIMESPFLEKLKKRDIECLLLDQSIDEYLVRSLFEFDGKKLESVSNERFSLGDEDETKDEAQEKKINALCKTMWGILIQKVKSVIPSKRIVDSPCCLVSEQWGWGANMQRIMQAQTLRSPELPSEVMVTKKIMEINPTHPIIKLLCNKIDNKENAKMIKDLVFLLYDTSLLTSGFSLQKPTTFASRIHKLIRLGLSDDEDDEDDEEDEVENVKLVTEEQDDVTEMEEID